MFTYISNENENYFTFFPWWFFLNSSSTSMSFIKFLTYPYCGRNVNLPEYPNCRVYKCRTQDDFGFTSEMWMAGNSTTTTVWVQVTATQYAAVIVPLKLKHCSIWYRLIFLKLTTNMGFFYCVSTENFKLLDRTFMEYLKITKWKSLC